jgi:hypothetical protein
VALDAGDGVIAMSWFQQVPDGVKLIRVAWFVCVTLAVLGAAWSANEIKENTAAMRKSPEEIEKRLRDRE